MKTEDLKPAARRRAGLAIENTHKEYVKADGLKSLTEKLERSEQRTSTYIYGLARYAFESQSDDPDALFDAMCNYAEEQFKAKHKVANVKDVLPPWATFKSNINRAIRLKLKPTDYATEWELRKAVAEEVSKTSGSAVQRTGTSPPPASTSHTTLLAPQAEDIAAHTTMHKKLKPLFVQIAVAVGFIREAAIEDAEEILSDASAKLAGLVDNRRVRDNATRDVLRQAIH